MVLRWLRHCLTSLMASRSTSPVYHNECAFHENNYKEDYWLKEGEQVLKKKECGRLIMVSRFITPRYGVLALTNKMKAENAKLPDGEHLLVTDSSIMIFPSLKATGDDYWNADQMNTQVGPYVTVLHAS
jgi:hypothetical protein